MFVRVDLATGNASLEEAQDCGRFHVAVVGGGAPGALDDALRSADVGHAETSDTGSAGAPGEHAWVAVEAVRRLAVGQVDESWEADFEAMLAYAAGKGWLDEMATHVRAHIERITTDG